MEIYYIRANFRYINGNKAIGGYDYIYRYRKGQIRAKFRLIEGFVKYTKI